MLTHEKGKFVNLAIKKPMVLDSGASLSNFTVAYQTYGKLNEEKTNAVLVCHALTGDQFVAEPHPITGKDGWWSIMVGSGKPIDTDKYFVICPNVIGGCMGSAGPASINPVTGKKYGLDFPVITIRDIAKAHKLLIDYLGIDKLMLCIGGSMGGAQVLELAAMYPEISKAHIVIAIGDKYSSQNIAFNETSRMAIMADSAWNNGNYDKQPAKGLSVARMGKFITYMSEKSLQDKFGRNLQKIKKIRYGFEADFQIESYLRYQGSSFVKRFDANSFLYLTRAIDYYDLEGEYGKSLVEIFKKCKSKFYLFSFTSDWCSPPHEAKRVAKSLNAAGVAVNYSEIKSDKGHDSFLLNIPEFLKAVRGFVDNIDKDIVRGDEVLETDRIIESFVERNSKLLDIGCGDGRLLRYLTVTKNINGHGIEIDSGKAGFCAASGLSVIQGDAEEDLDIYEDSSYDYVVLSQTIQAMKNPKYILEEMLRIGKKAIVTLPNFGHWRVRINLLTNGRMPVNKNLPYSWYETPNIHFCTIKDFEILCNELGIKIERRVVNGKNNFIFPNFLGTEAIYILSR